MAKETRYPLEKRLSPLAPITGAGGLSLFGGCLFSRYAASRFLLTQARPRVELTASRP